MLGYTAPGSQRRPGAGVLRRMIPQPSEPARRSARAPMTRLAPAASQAEAEVSPPIGNSDPPPSSGSAPNSDATGAPQDAVRNSFVSEPTPLRYIALTGTTISATAAASTTTTTSATARRARWVLVI